jgi:hypothetical protein
MGHGQLLLVRALFLAFFDAQARKFFCTEEPLPLLFRFLNDVILVGLHLVAIFPHFPFEYFHVFDFES